MKKSIAVVILLLTHSLGAGAKSQAQQKAVEVLIGQPGVQAEYQYVKAKPSEALKFEGQPICAEGFVESILGDESGSTRIVVADAMTGPRLEALVSKKVAEVIDEGDEVRVCGPPSRKPDSNRAVISSVEILQRLDKAESRRGASATTWQTYVGDDRQFQVRYPQRFGYIEVDLARHSVFIGENKYSAVGVEIRQFPGSCVPSSKPSSKVVGTESESELVRIEKLVVNGQEREIELRMNGRQLLDFVVQVSTAASCFQITGTAPTKSKVDQRLVTQTIRTFIVMSK